MFCPARAVLRSSILSGKCGRGYVCFSFCGLSGNDLDPFAWELCEVVVFMEFSGSFSELLGCCNRECEVKVLHNLVYFGEGWFVGGVCLHNMFREREFKPVVG